VTVLPVVVTASAASAITEAKEWWAQNRASAATPLADDLERAFELIAAHPAIGARATNVSLSGVRRVHIARIRYHLYYRVSPTGDNIEVLAFWHTSRGSDPAIPDP
jgi:plasmid stabilization system protein ParE